jgi:hypothetical protein
MQFEPESLLVAAKLFNIPKMRANQFFRYKFHITIHKVMFLEIQPTDIQWFFGKEAKNIALTIKSATSR